MKYLDSTMLSCVITAIPLMFELIMVYLLGHLPAFLAFLICFFSLLNKKLQIFPLQQLPEHDSKLINNHKGKLFADRSHPMITILSMIPPTIDPTINHPWLQSD